MEVLHVPADVAWYEIDMPDVVKAKLDRLRSAGVQLSSKEDRADTEYRLLCAEYQCFVADLDKRQVVLADAAKSAAGLSSWWSGALLWC